MDSWNSTVYEKVASSSCFADCRGDRAAYCSDAGTCDASGGASVADPPCTCEDGRNGHHCEVHHPGTRLLLSHPPLNQDPHSHTLQSGVIYVAHIPSRYRSSYAPTRNAPATRIVGTRCRMDGAAPAMWDGVVRAMSVSYTHLTLPTITEV